MTRTLLLAAASLLAVSAAQAQDHAGHGAPDPHAGHAAPPTADDPHAGHAMPPAPAHPHAGHDMSGMADHGGHAMRAYYGPYPAHREASGTAWVPESGPMTAWHFGEPSGWSGMVHGSAWLVYSDQGGRRGDYELFGASMLMGMANRPLGPGVFGVRGMVSADPLTMGDDGYPLLLQTGETADGTTPLVDRQHPHDLFAELAVTYSVPVGEDGSMFGYLGYPGEPALGPPTYLHRLSGEPNPEAPLGHHWFDSTHITFGVATVGATWRGWKLEGSAFTGREPDEERYDFDDPEFDSRSVRLTWNPTPDWSLQVSQGRLKSPEALEADLDQTRTTASAIYNRPLSDGNWQTTLAWGRNDKEPGESTDALLLESALTLGRHTVFGRVEQIDKDELFPDHSDPLHDIPFEVRKGSIGYLYELPIAEHAALALGGMVSGHELPEAIQPSYGGEPASGVLFARVRIR